MKIAILTAEYFSDAIINLLDDAGYAIANSGNGYGDKDYVLVNITKRTYKDADTDGGRPVYHPGNQFGDIQALLSGASGGATATASDTAPATVGNATDAAGNSLSIGDTVLVLTANPDRRDGKFVLPDNGVLTITKITAKGAIGFGGPDQYLPARFQKATLEAVPPVPASGTLVIAAPRRDGRFALPVDTALVFRGLTTSGKFILDGYAQDQYAPGRFHAVIVVG